MKQQTILTHEFVEYMPDELKDGTLYVSMPFATVAHKCCCGCGKEVVTPLSPTDWKLIYAGDPSRSTLRLEIGAFLASLITGYVAVRSDGPVPGLKKKSMPDEPMIDLRKKDTSNRRALLLPVHEKSRGDVSGESSSGGRAR